MKPQQIDTEDTKKIVLAQNFLKQQLQTLDNPNLLSTVIYAYNDNTPYSQEKAELVNDAIDRLAALTKVDPQSLFSEKFDLDINDVSGTSLNHLIGQLEDTQYKDKFTQLILGKIDTGLNSKMLSQPNQSEISGYLLNQIQQKSEGFDDTNDSNIIRLTKAFDIYSTIKAYGSFANERDYLANAILSTQNSRLQAALIMSALHNSEVIKVLKAHKQQLILHLDNSITDADQRPPVSISTSDPQSMGAQENLRVKKRLLQTKQYNNNVAGNPNNPSNLVQSAIYNLNKM